MNSLQNEQSSKLCSLFVLWLLPIFQGVNLDDVAKSDNLLWVDCVPATFSSFSSSQSSEDRSTQRFKLGADNDLRELCSHISKFLSSHPACSVVVDDVSLLREYYSDGTIFDFCGFLKSCCKPQVRIELNCFAFLGSLFWFQVFFGYFNLSNHTLCLWNRANHRGYVRVEVWRGEEEGIQNWCSVTIDSTGMYKIVLRRVWMWPWINRLVTGRERCNVP